jgi:methylthioribose-1-phosphate isomerase
VSGATATAPFETVCWQGDAASGCVLLIDQTRLPTEFVAIECRDVPAVWEAIRTLRVRGAPAIGIAAAFGSVLGARAGGTSDGAIMLRALHEATATLRTSRPTAVNLFWALDRMDRVAEAHRHLEPAALLDLLLEEARAIAAEDKAMCRAIGGFGAALLARGRGS